VCLIRGASTSTSLGFTWGHSEGREKGMEIERDEGGGERKRKEERRNDKA
jgi:hypothetical protein